jgi:60 kDa SS-A/Ro ribonucleoprotein
VSGLKFGGTDCALPFTYALENKMEVDTVVVITDNETWAGHVHPYQALENYRREMGIDTKLVVLGVTATESSITNPDDAGSLAVVGWDTAVPKLISDFSRGL